MKVRIDPVVGTFQPDLIIALIPPAGQGRCRYLVALIYVQVISWRNQLEYILVIGDFSYQVIEPLRPFKPPVPEELCVVRCDHDWLSVHYRCEILNLPFSVEHKVPGMDRGFSQCAFPVVRLFVMGLSGDPVILYSCADPSSARVDIRFYVFVVQIISDVPVKLPVIIVSRISFPCAPNLLR